MGKKHILIATAIISLLTSCKEQKKEVSKKNTVEEIVISDVEDPGNSIDYDKTKVLETLYVIDRNGTEIKDQADENSKTLGK